MKRSGLLFAWTLLGVLAIAAVMITLERREAVADPRIDSFRPSGLAAFADLLRSNGYRVESTMSAAPSLAKDDVVVACVDDSSDESNIETQIDDDTPGVLGRLSNFIQDGGRAILLPFARDFGDQSQTVQDRNAFSEISQAPLNVATRQIPPDRLLGLPEDLVTVGLIHDRVGPKTDISWLARYTDGTVLSFADGYMASNRFIDRAQNADALMASISAIAPKGSRVLFVEAAYSNEQAGLLEILGPGATGAWYQALFLFVVIVFTLGKRFGLPGEVRPTQTGQRELVDAIADTYRRARSTRAACRAAYERADRDVRKALKLSSDAPASERDFKVPLELASAFRRVFEGTIDVVSPQDAFQRCQTLGRLASEFVRPGSSIR